VTGFALRPGKNEFKSIVFSGVRCIGCGGFELQVFCKDVSAAFLTGPLTGMGLFAAARTRTLPVK
jgi:hypothetical protein